MRIKITTLLLTATLFATPVVAEVYKCVDDKGKSRFSDQPCGDNAETLTIETQSSGIGGASGDWSAVVGANRERDRDRAIDRHESTVIRLIDERDASLAALRNKKRRASNNLAGAQWEQSISQEMQAVAEDYNARIQSEREIVRDLRNQ